MAELIDILDENGSPTGEVLEKNLAHQLHKIHRTAKVWIINSGGELLFQLRAPGKDTIPNMWDASAAGHVSAGETVQQGLTREILEELGIHISPEQLIELYTLKNLDRYHISTSFLTRLDLPVGAYKFNTKEISALRYIPWRELAKMSEQEMLDNKIYPYPEFKDLFKYLENNGY